jgi:hypothetical protein
VATDSDAGRCAGEKGKPSSFGRVKRHTRSGGGRQPGWGKVRSVAVEIILPLSGETRSMAAKDILEAIGLGTPFIFATATYGLFYWLDRNASAQANRAISTLLKGEPYRRLDSRMAILATFDRLYTSPLFRIRAFIRSAILSTISFGVSLLFVSGLNPYSNLRLLSYYIPYLSATIFSDYISIFWVRRCLYFAGDHPIGALFLSLLVGMAVVSVIFWAAIGVSMLLFPFSIEVSNPSLFVYVELFFSELLDPITRPALFVHLWLPLFALGALGVRLLYPLFRAVKWAQWFLKQGNQHPLRAIGMVAGVLVFMGTAIARLLAPIM